MMMYTWHKVYGVVDGSNSSSEKTCRLQLAHEHVTLT